MADRYPPGMTERRAIAQDPYLGDGAGFSHLLRSFAFSARRVSLAANVALKLISRGDRWRSATVFNGHTTVTVNIGDQGRDLGNIGYQLTPGTNVNFPVPPGAELWAMATSAITVLSVLTSELPPPTNSTVATVSPDAASIGPTGGKT